MPACPAQRVPAPSRVLRALFIAACCVSSADGQRSSFASAAPTSDTPPSLAEEVPVDVTPSCEEFDPVRRLPDGTPARLDCRAARRIITQVRARLALPVRTPQPGPFGEALLGWLDPHGLWSAAPDAPIAELTRGVASGLLQELESPEVPALPCRAAGEVGAALREWITSLQEDYARGAATARTVSRPAAFRTALESPFEDDPVRKPARQLAAELGRRTAVFARAYGAEGAQVAAVAARRYLPELSSEDWARVVLVAAVRAYVASVDPHGAWAPFSEEFTLHDGESAGYPPQLWGEMSRTSVGVRVSGAPAPPLREGDLVLEIDGLPTAGLSVEVVDQLALLEPRLDERARWVRVLRAGAPAPLSLSIDLPGEDASPALPELDVRRVPFADGFALVLAIPHVAEGLGEALGQLVTRLPPSVRGILLDLRGNGGGSMDGAAGAIGVFLPGMPLFPLRSRDGGIEVLRALSPPPQAIYRGPVAAVVDGDTASAAEMIAAALQGYRRGLVLGGRTFGKGCVQEYFEDRAGAGVLRLTTLLFSAPDGQALQSVGVTPDLALPSESASAREADLPAALRAWTGPDVRVPADALWPAWPVDGRVVRRCRQDAGICLALSRLGEDRNPMARWRVKSGARVSTRPGPSFPPAQP